MRATQIYWSFVAVILVLAAAASAKEKLSKAPADNSLVVGDGYFLRVERNGAGKQFRGDLVKLTDRWIVLRRISVSSLRREIPVLSTIPLVGGVFYASIPERHDEFLWIPREAATVEKRIQPAKPLVIKAPEGDEPPTKVACAVELVVGKKAVQREGGMQAIKDDKVTLAVTTTIPFEMPTSALGAITSAGDSKRPKARYSREQFARKDILCVRVPNFDVAELEALAH